MPERVAVSDIFVGINGTGKTTAATLTIIVAYAQISTFR